MRERSLKKKLIIRNTIVLSAMFVAFMVMLVKLNLDNTQILIERTSEQALNALITQGNSMVSDKDIVLKVAAEYNGFPMVQELVAKNYEQSDVVDFGGYVNNDFELWAWADVGNPSGELETRKDQNPITEWALSLDKYGYRKNSDTGLYEFSAPIYIPVLDDNEAPVDRDGDGVNDSIKMGAIIYGLNTRQMETLVSEAEEQLKNSLYKTLMILGVLGLISLAFGIVVTQRSAATITQPLETLTGAADTIASGDYNIIEMVASIQSRDELQTLALSFGQMAKDINSRDADLKTKNRELNRAQAELEDLNKHLEEKVKERTKQLTESESKFRTLFEESADATLVTTEERFLDCNPAMLHMMSLKTKADFLAMDPGRISPEFQPDGQESPGAMRNHIARARSEGSQQFEWVNRRIEDSEEFHTEIVITSFPLNGESVLHMVFRDITARKKIEAELKKTQQKLVETAHSAGMAEIATGVLHNIGNILNSVNISTEEIAGTLKGSKLKGFLKANEIVSSHKDDIGAFFTAHPKGKLIPGYFQSLGEAMHDEQVIMTNEIVALGEKVSMMRDVISTQQNYAKATLYTEDVVLSDIIEDALKLNMAALKKQGVRVDRVYDQQLRGTVPKVKLIHVLTNLIKNGKEAMYQNDKFNKAQTLKIEVRRYESNQVEIMVSDNGCGIEFDNLEKIFNHGFTTKDHGHGFGLHTCANFMTEMGGSLSAESEGLSNGSCFIVRFPLVCRGPKQVTELESVN